MSLARCPGVLHAAAVERATTETRPRLRWSHQYPMGVPMSLGRRAALLAWAELRDAVIVEDDYDSEFRFGGRPLDPLQSLDRGGRVIYVGTFSKVMLPVFRLGFLVAPASLRTPLRSAKWLTDCQGVVPFQGALARFIDEGLLARHVRKATREYATRRDRVIAILQRDFRDRLNVVPSTAGLHVAALFRRSVGLSDETVVRRAEEAGVMLRALSPMYFDGPARRGLVIGFGSISVPRIAEGLKRLDACF